MSDSVKETEDDIIEVYENGDDEDSLEEPATSDTASEEPNTSQVSTINTTTQNSSQQQETKPASDSKFFAIRITGGQENVVANILQNKINSKRISLRSILILENFKGYVIVEAPDSNIAYDALYGVRHVRGQIRGDLPFSDIEKYLIKKPVVTELSIDDTVEV